MDITNAFRELELDTDTDIIFKSSYTFNRFKSTVGVIEYRIAKDGVVISNES